MEFSKNFSNPYSQFCEEFWLSESTGLLIDPSYKLSSEFSEWFSICENLYELTQSKKIREKVNNLPLISTKNLEKHSDIIAAISLLMNIINSFIWCDSPPPEKLPKQLAEPFWDLSEKLDIPKVFSCVELLFNWKFDENNDIFPRFSFTNHVGEKYFLGIAQNSVFVFGNIFKDIYEANQAAENNQLETFVEKLQEISKKFELISKKMGKMYENLPSDFYFNGLKPYLKGFTEPFYPNGIYFEGIGKYVKETAVVTDPSFYIFEYSLGLVYNEELTKIRTSIIKYACKKHRELIEFYKKNSLIREFAQKNEKSKIAYNSVLTKLADFFKVLYIFLYFSLIMVF